MPKKAQKKLQEKSLQSKTNKEDDAAEVQRCIERLRDLLQGNIVRSCTGYLWKEFHTTIAHLILLKVPKR
jgi:hypothetical protein